MAVKEIITCMGAMTTTPEISSENNELGKYQIKYTPDRTPLSERREGIKQLLTYTHTCLIILTSPSKRATLFTIHLYCNHTNPLIHNNNYFTSHLPYPLLLHLPNTKLCST